jgi:hypothetical protein
MDTLTCFIRHHLGAFHVSHSRCGDTVTDKPFLTPRSTTAVGHFLEWERLFTVERKWGAGLNLDPNSESLSLLSSMAELWPIFVVDPLMRSATATSFVSCRQSVSVVGPS